MSNIIINRWYTPDSTLGRFQIENFHCFSLELPNLNNASNISCIPEGNYSYFARYSPGNKSTVLQLQNVKDRTYIQIHAGNYTRQILGCILVGDAIKYIDNDTIPDVVNSKNTLGKVLALAGDTGIVSLRGGYT